MVIRPLIESDYDNLVELYFQLDHMHVQARPDYFVPRDRDAVYPKDAFVHNLAYPDCIELGAFDGDQLIGFASATLWRESGMRKDLKTACLDNIYVLSEYRRKGIATKLCAEGESWARKQGARRLELHTWHFNKNAIAMYEAMGMHPQRYVLEKEL